MWVSYSTKAKPRVNPGPFFEAKRPFSHLLLPGSHANGSDLISILKETAPRFQQAIVGKSSCSSADLAVGGAAHPASPLHFLTKLNKLKASLS